MSASRAFPRIHRIQWLILRKMISAEQWRFNEIKFEDMDPNQFTHHLKQLLKLELVGYDTASKRYYIDTNGKILMDYFRNIPNFAELPVNTSVLLHVVRDGKILVVKRARVPSLHHIGNPSANTSVDLSLQDTAQALLTSFGLSGELRLSLILEMLYVTKKQLPFTHDLFFVYYSDSVQGDTRSRCDEGELLWMSPNELSKVKKGYKNTKDILALFQNPKLVPAAPQMITKSYIRDF